MDLFSTRDKLHGGSMQSGNPEVVVSKLDAALTAIFSEDGKRTVLYYMTSKFGLTLEEASTDPSKLERALTDLLGEIGWMVVKRAILEVFWDKRIPLNDTVVVERASLLEVFGFARGLALGRILP